MEKKISVIIPNYNGQKLLSQNLPNVIKNCPECETIIVDDASSDESVNFLKKNFKKIKLIKNVRNLGFARSVNIGVKNAKGKLLLFLNSDVSPRPNFLSFAMSHFKDEKVFGVALADYSHEDGKIITRGRGRASFSQGFLVHSAADTTRGETFWVSGGASLVDRQKFQQLSGFDPVYAPFYWEDIDLAYRARKAGFICVFEPKSQVDHYHHEGAIAKFHSPFFIKTVSYKNQFLFVWKNISDPLFLMQHLLWQPYHFAKSLLTIDLPFFMGFFWALLHIPKLIFNSQFSTLNPQLSDREVLKKFEKS